MVTRKKKRVSCDVFMFMREGDSLAAEATKSGFLGEKPVYKTTHAAAADVCVPSITVIEPHTAAKVPLRIGFDIPDGYCVMMYPRSSLLFIGLLSPVSIIDRDFSRNEVHFTAYNMTDKPVRLEAGERVAQVMLVPYVDVPEWDHEDNARDPRGFGGTGRA